MEGYFLQTCIHQGCGISWYHPIGFDQQRRKNHSLFYCPNGHGQYYSEKNEEEILRDKVKELERKLSSTEWSLKYCENSRKSLKGEITKLKNKRR